MSLERLDELARRARAALQGRRYAELRELEAEQLVLLSTLHDELDRDALPALERLLQSSREIEQGLVARLVETQGAIERLRSGRRAIGGYAPGAAPARALEVHV